MKLKITLTFIFLLSLQYGNSQSPGFSWARSFGNASATDIASSVWVDSAGNVYNTGNFSGTVDFDPGPGVLNLVSTGSKSAYIQKLNPFGELIWAKSFGGNSLVEPHDITVDKSGNIITVGKFLELVDFNPGSGPDSIFNIQSVGLGGGVFPSDTYNMFVQKLDPNGNFLWAVSFGAPTAASNGGGTADAVATDSTGNIYLTGAFVYSVDFDPGPGTTIYSGGNSKPFVLRLTNTGSLAWAAAYGDGGGGNDIFYRDGNIYLASSVTFGIGSIPYLSVKRLSPDGVVYWEKVVTANAGAIAFSITADKTGHVITTGTFSGGAADFDPGAGPDSIKTLVSTDGPTFIQKLDSLGRFDWAQNYSTSINSITTDMRSNIYTAGSFAGTQNFNFAGNFPLSTTSGRAAFLQELDSLGAFVWAGQFGNNGNEIATDVNWDNKNGSLLISGVFTGTQDFDPGIGVQNLTSVSNSQDAFIVKMSTLASLPVKLSYFNATAGKNTAVISWQTTSEINTANFEILRSKNGVDFDVIGNVKATGNPGVTSNYSFTDYTPFAEDYYRLRSADKDGKFEYSEIRKVIFTKNGNSLIYPNPASSIIHIVTTGDLKSAELFDLNGNLIHVWKPNLNNQYNIGKYASGVYLIKLTYTQKQEILYLNKQ